MAAADEAGLVKLPGLHGVSCGLASEHAFDGALQSCVPKCFP